jgi:type VI protein secretion system component VasK
LEADTGTVFDVCSEFDFVLLLLLLLLFLLLLLLLLLLMPLLLLALVVPFLDFEKQLPISCVVVNLLMKGVVVMMLLLCSVLFVGEKTVKNQLFFWNEQQRRTHQSLGMLLSQE